MFRQAVAGLAIVVVAACEPPSTVDPADPPIDFELRQQLVYSRVVPVRAVPPQSPALVELGRALFFDKVLSGNRDVSCATCHDPREGTGDGRSASVPSGLSVR